MENEKLTFTNSRGESLELGTDSIFFCNISKDVGGIAGVTIQNDSKDGVGHGK